MSESAADQMRRFVPACAAETDTVLNLWLADAVKRMNRVMWGEDLQPGACYLAGHLYLRAQWSASQHGAGTVTSEGTGGMSMGFSTLPGRLTDADLQTTIPGAQYVALRDEVGGPFTLVDVLDDSQAP